MVRKTLRRSAEWSGSVKELLKHSLTLDRIRFFGLFFGIWISSAAIKRFNHVVGFVDAFGVM
jgi:hypothetical protein